MRCVKMAWLAEEWPQGLWVQPVWQAGWSRIPHSALEYFPFDFCFFSLARLSGNHSLYSWRPSGTAWPPLLPVRQTLIPPSSGDQLCPESEHPKLLPAQDPLRSWGVGGYQPPGKKGC